MPGKHVNKLTKRTVDGLRVEGKDAIFWDRDLPGFGVRVYPTGRKVYVVQSRGPTGPKRATIGRHGAVSADQARKQATVIIDRIKRGETPAPRPPPRELTVADLAERYLRVHVQVNCRRSSWAVYRRIVSHYIVPELGECPIAAVTCRGVSVRAVAAIRLLMLTGCRRNEILTLRWEDVDPAANELYLRDSKTGARTLSLSPEAGKVLSELPRIPDNPFVIAGRLKGTHMRNVNGPWTIIRKRAGLEDVRLHDLRHSFASRALALGESLPMIGKLLGHSQIETTARYAHLARESVHESAARIADSIAADLVSNGGELRTA